MERCYSNEFKKRQRQNSHRSTLKLERRENSDRNKQPKMNSANYVRKFPKRKITYKIKSRKKKPTKPSKQIQVKKDRKRLKPKDISDILFNKIRRNKNKKTMKPKNKFKFPSRKIKTQKKLKVKTKLKILKKNQV